MRKLFLCFIFVAFYCFAYAQQYATCDKAVEIRSSTVSNIKTSVAPDQLCAERNSGGKYFDLEHNIAWLTFTAPNDTVLTFDITPDAPGDDIDFLLFRVADGTPFCSQLGGISNNDPIRTNLSKVKGPVGLSKKVQDKIVGGSGISSYSKALLVNKGERYYLIVDDKTQQGTISVNVHLNFALLPPPVQKSTSYIDANPVKIQRPEAPVDVLPAVNETPALPIDRDKTICTVSVQDTLGNPVKAVLEIEGLTKEKTYTRVAAQDSFSLNPAQTISVDCNAPGYLYEQISYVAPNTPTRNTLKLVMHKFRLHQKIVLKGIEFEEGNAKLLPSSNAPLMNVISFLKTNASVNVMINGYVNDPYGYDSAPAKKLSRQRAAAVLNYLRMKGIDLPRMDYEGYGNEVMIYPHPVNSEQEQANRRVEIEIR